jgi:predicted transcriptional regulator
MKNRTHSDICYLILSAAMPGERKTRIMFKAGISSRQLTTYVDSLIEKEWLEYLEGSSSYITTKKGIEFMKAYEGLVQESTGLPKMAS